MDRWTDLLGDYIDGALPESTRAELEAHLGDCESCRTLLADLGRIKEVAGGLEPLVPSADLWNRIASRLAEDQTTSRTDRAFRRMEDSQRMRRLLAWRAPPQAARLIAIAALLILVVAGSLGWWTRSHRGTQVTPATEIGTSNVPSGDLVESIESELKLAQEHYEKAVAGFEQIARSNEARVDPQVAETLQKNMAVIDQAINESRAAVLAQPQSQVAQETLLEAFQRKVGFLQDTIALMNEMRKGDPEGVGRVAEGVNRPRQE